MCPLSPPASAIPSKGSGPTPIAPTPTPSARVEVDLGGTYSPLSSLSFSVRPTSESNHATASKKLVGTEEKGGALPFVAIGAKVHPRMYDELRIAAAREGVDFSDVIREGIALALQVRGFDQGARITDEALIAAKASLDALRAEADKTARGKVLQHSQPQYRSPDLVKAARLYPSQVATAIRLWTKPETHGILLRAIGDATTAPPILHPLRSFFGSYAGLRDVLVAETGVPT